MAKSIKKIHYNLTQLNNAVQSHIKSLEATLGKINGKRASKVIRATRTVIHSANGLGVLGTLATGKKSYSSTRSSSSSSQMLSDIASALSKAMKRNL